MTLTGARAFVTGGGGFIGSHLVERLVALGVEVRVLVRYTSSSSCGWLDRSPVRDKIEVVWGDVTDPEILRKAMKGMEYVFNLAALISIPYSYEAPRSYVRTNIEGSANVLQTALEEGVQRFVQISTSEVYGTARFVPISEKHPLQAQSPYAASKIGADQLALSFFLSYDLPVVIARPFNAYGPRQSSRAIVPTIITQALAGEAIRLGNLRPTRDLTYVADTVEGMIRAAECDAAIGRTINVGNGREISIQELTKLILSVAGRSVNIDVQDERLRPTGSEVERLCADRSLASEILGWEPTYSLREGITRTVQWISENLHYYRVGAYNV